HYRWGARQAVDQHRRATRIRDPAGEPNHGVRPRAETGRRPRLAPDRPRLAAPRLSEGSALARGPDGSRGRELGQPQLEGPAPLRPRARVRLERDPATRG